MRLSYSEPKIISINSIDLRLIMLNSYSNLPSTTHTDLNLESTIALTPASSYSLVKPNICPIAGNSAGTSFLADETQVKLEFGRQLDQIQHEMEKRANNMGYGLGIGLGRAIGSRPKDDFHTPIQNVASQAVEDATNEALSSCSSDPWFKSLWQVCSSAFSKLINTFGFEEQKYAMEFITDAEADHNGAFGVDRWYNKEADSLLKRHSVKHFKRRIHSVDDICQILPAEHLNQKFDIIIFSGHGRMLSIQFGANQIPFENRFLDVMNIHHKIDCLSNYLNQNAKIILKSCSTGAIANLPFDSTYQEALPASNIELLDILERFINFVEGLFYSEGNIAFEIYKFLSKSHPDIEVIAPSLNSYGMFITSVEPLTVIAPSKNPNGDWINSAVSYNARSFELIKEGKTLIQNQPNNGILNLGVFITLESLENYKRWHKIFKENQEALAKAMHYIPAAQQVASSEYVNLIFSNDASEYTSKGAACASSQSAEISTKTSSHELVTSFAP